MAADPGIEFALAALPAEAVSRLFGAPVAVGFEVAIDRKPTVRGIQGQGTGCQAGSGSGSVEGLLLPEERPAVAKASAHRALEFAAGRACARAGLASLGLPQVAIPRGEDRSPQWPAGIEGSISHTDGRVMAVVARSEHLLADSGGSGAVSRAGLGIDIEQRGRVHRALYDKLFTAREIEELGRASADDELFEAAIRFSAKEAFYKAQYRLTKAWVSFTDVSIHRAPSGQFVVEPATTLEALKHLEWPVAIGHTIDDTYVTTGVVVRSVERQG